MQEQKAHLPGLLKRGAEAYDFRETRWTAKHVAVILERAFGVRRHLGHVWRLL